MRYKEYFIVLLDTPKDCGSMFVKKNIMIIYFQIIILIMCVIEYFYFFSLTDTMSEFSVEFLKYELLFIYIWTIITANFFLPWKHIYFFFLLSMGIFQFNRIFLDILELYNFEYASKWGYFYFPTWTSVELLMLFIFALSLIHLGALVAIYFLKDDSKKLFYSERLFQIGRTVFFLAYPLFMYKLIMQVKYILKNGYLSVYTEAFKHLDYPIWTKGSGTLLVVGFSFILASRVNKKSFLFYSFLFLISQMAIMLQGARGGLIVSFMIIVWYYYKFYMVKDINIKKIFFLGMGIILLAQIITISRSGSNFEINNFSKIFLLFFQEQGTSIQVPFYMIYYKEQFINNGLPYIFDPLIRIGVLSPAQTVDSLLNYNSLANHLTYFLNSKAYFRGEGTGESFISEVYELPLLLMVFLFFILGYFIIYFDKFVMKKRWLLLFVYIISFTIIWMPRGHFFPNINLIIIIIVFYIFAHLIKQKSIK